MKGNLSYLGLRELVNQLTAGLQIFRLSVDLQSDVDDVDWFFLTCCGLNGRKIANRNINISSNTSN